jgi:two-component system response regulator RegX3
MANILIVEDDKDLNRAYQMILRREKHTIEAAYNGAEALEKLQTFTPDLVLLDLLMPVKSGVDFLRDYDIRYKHPDVRVVVFTNLENSPQINEAFGLGAYKCVIKSWTAPNGLVKVVNDVLNTQNETSSVPD